MTSASPASTSFPLIDTPLTRGAALAELMPDQKPLIDDVQQKPLALDEGSAPMPAAGEPTDEEPAPIAPQA